MRLSHDEALLWLNDRLGRHALVSVHLDNDLSAEDRPAIPLTVAGVLSHWRQDYPEDDYADDSLRGLYEVGGDPVQLNVNSLGDAVSHVSGTTDVLQFVIGVGVRLSVLVGTEEDER